MAPSENKISRSRDIALRFVHVPHQSLYGLLDRLGDEPDSLVEISGRASTGYEVTVTRTVHATLYVNYTYAEEI